MKYVAPILRFLGVLFFILLAVGYYREGLVINGVIAAIVGGLCAAPAAKFPYGIRLKASLIIAGVIVILAMAPIGT